MCLPSLSSRQGLLALDLALAAWQATVLPIMNGTFELGAATCPWLAGRLLALWLGAAVHRATVLIGCYGWPGQARLKPFGFGSGVRLCEA